MTVSSPHSPAATDPTHNAARWWRRALLFIAALTLARLLFLLFLSPYELSGDEAQYWDWSRRLDLSYYSKGPGVAWIIALPTAIFGHHEWSVRLPAVLCGAVSMFAAARLAHRIAPKRDARAAFFGAVAWSLIPAYHATALLMTIDGPYIMCWILSAWAAYEALDRNAPHHRAILCWGAFGLALGVGFLFKYTILLLPPGILLFMILDRRAHARTRTLLGLALATTIFLIIASPVFIWNAREGWPTVKHLLGHLGAPGGDVTPRAETGKPWSPLWSIEFIGAQIALVGPALVLMFLAARALPNPARAFMICCAAPILLFYLAISLLTDAEGNWPIAAYATLAVLVGAAAPNALDHHRALLRNWRANAGRPRAGIFRRAPETPFQIAWHWSIGYAAVAAIGMTLLIPLAQLPFIGDLFPARRLTGSRAVADEVQRVRDAVRHAIPTHEPFLVADRYERAALLAFYLPDHPPVASATSFLGGRPSSYDHFPDTNLRRPELINKPAILVGGGTPKWTRAFAFDALNLAERTIPIHAAARFLGPYDATEQP